MAARGRGRRRRGGHAGAHENEERWLLTYADMITLLMALFMVLFSISSVNISKYQVLQQSLKAAFSGSILPGGKAIMQTGAESTSQHKATTAEIPSIVALNPTQGKSQSQAMNTAQLQAALNNMSGAIREQNELLSLKRKLDAYARAHGFAGQVQTVLERRGLVVRVLADKVLFDSGQANLQPQGLPLLSEIAALLNVDRSHPITVEGHTDNVPISSAQFPSNWELSTARATTVVRYLISRSVSAGRLGAAGYAALHPVASNATAAGRALNRRVEIVIERLYPTPPS